MPKRGPVPRRVVLASASPRRRDLLEAAGFEVIVRPAGVEDLPEGPARKRILHLAFQFDLSSYDAAYLELADRHKIPLYTADARLQTAAKQLGLLPK
jgi:predicted nucleic acid-binding protein